MVLEKANNRQKEHKRECEDKIGQLELKSKSKFYKQTIQKVCFEFLECTAVFMLPLSVMEINN